MRVVASAVVQGFNDYVQQQQQQQEGTMLLTLAQFDSIRPLDYVFEAQDIRAVKPLTPAQLRPRGTAAPLYDAVADVISRAERLEQGKRSEVVVVVFSDGAEKASKDHSQQQVFQMVEAKRRAGWTFVFLGANQDSYAAGGSLAISKGAVSNFRADARGVRAVYSDLSQGTTRMRKAARKAKHSSSAANALPEARAPESSPPADARRVA